MDVPGTEEGMWGMIDDFEGARFEIRTVPTIPPRYICVTHKQYTQALKGVCSLIQRAFPEDL